MASRAILAAGCFWQPELSFARTPGVVATRVGYCGGTVANPSYEQVCTGRTGHAEAVEVTFDPAQISFAQLLDVFWRIHDPTQVNRQGADVGPQYRSAIFYLDDEQRAVAEESRAREDASGRHRAAIATEITPAGTFYPAEDYHQRFLEKRGLA